jgi:hypothetical protein
MSCTPLHPDSTLSRREPSLSRFHTFRDSCAAENRNFPYGSNRMLYTGVASGRVDVIYLI